MQSIVNRMGWVLAGTVSLLALAAIAGIVHGGPLDPPGPPASTAGVLRPGTPITSLPFTIAQPGSYYLTGNLTMTQPGDGITITTDGVTLDLGGFALDGGGIGTNGVSIPSRGQVISQSITVRNGRADNWTGAGFQLQYASTLVDDVQASHDAIGIVIDGGALTHCSVNFDTNTGVEAAFTTISDCNAQVDATGFDLFEGSLTHCDVDGSTVAGIKGQRATISDCTMDQNSGDGMLLQDASNVHDNLIEFSGANGIRDNGNGSIIENNTMYGNGVSILASGIYCPADRNRISHNTVSATNGEGIAIDGSFNTIDDNSTFQNTDIGIKVQGSKNTVVKNSSTGNGPSLPATNYSIIAGNNPGPLDAANAASNPWSNTQ